MPTQLFDKEGADVWGEICGWTTRCTVPTIQRLNTRALFCPNERRLSMQLRLFLAFHLFYCHYPTLKVMPWLFTVNTRQTWSSSRGVSGFEQGNKTQNANTRHKQHVGSLCCYDNLCIHINSQRPCSQVIQRLDKGRKSRVKKRYISVGGCATVSSPRFLPLPSYRLPPLSTCITWKFQWQSFEKEFDKNMKRIAT